MATLNITANTAVFENDDDVKETISIGFNETTKQNEWTLITAQGQSSVFTYDNVSELDLIINKWLTADGLEKVYDFSLSMVDNQWNDQYEVAEKFHSTPTHLPIFVPTGRIAHVGNGVWLTRCKHCNHAVTHYGVMQRYATTGNHEVTVHDGQVAGINVGMLP